MFHVRVQRIIALAIMLLQVGCSAITGAESDFARAHLLWTSERPAAYEYTLTHSCFCGTDVTRPVVIVVRGNTVESRRYDESWYTLTNFHVR